MEIIENKNLTKKLKNLKRLGNDTLSTMIVGVDKKGKIIPMSQEIFELVVVSLIDNNGKIIDCFGRKFKVTADEIK